MPSHKKVTTSYNDTKLRQGLKMKEAKHGLIY